MESLIVYDTNHYNTRLIAETIGSAIAGATVIPVSEVSPHTLKSINLLIVGSPTNGGRATEMMQAFLSQIPSNSLDGVHFAAFDTRFAINEHGFGLKIVMKTIGFAADKIAQKLQENGGVQIIRPEGFIVDNKEGPLHKGELDRTVSWAKQICSSMQTVS